MYPGQSEKFLSAYKMVTSKPYRYLAIDLKPDTPNDKHLWPKVLSRPIRHQQQSSHISIIQSRRQAQKKNSSRPKKLSKFQKARTYPLIDLKTYKRGTPPLQFQFSKEPMNVEDMAFIMACASCDECGLLYETLSDLQNHVRNWC